MRRAVAAECDTRHVLLAGAVSYTHLTLPTSDLRVDLGGRRIIKKKQKSDPEWLHNLYNQLLIEAIVSLYLKHKQLSRQQNIRESHVNQ